MKRKLNVVIDKLSSATKKLKYSSRKIKRLSKKVSSLETVVDSLKKENLISTDYEAVLRSTFSSVPLAVLQRIMHQKDKKISRIAFPEDF